MSKKDIVKHESKTVATTEPSERILNALAEVSDNLKSVENYQLPRLKMNADGFQLADGEPAVNEVQGILIHAKRTNVYYAKPFRKGDINPPDCFSLDGVTPDKSIEKPVHKTCKGCPMAEFGTNSMKSGKACRNLKPLYLLRESEDGLSIIPRQLTITPTSLKAANGYLMDLTERGIAYRKVLTKITTFKDDPDDKFVKLKFSFTKKLSDQEVKDVEKIKAQWLPIMDAQLADVVDNDEAPKVAKATGEY